MNFGIMTDNVIGKNSLNFGWSGSEIRKKYFQFQEPECLLEEHNVSVIRPLEDATTSFARTFGR